MANKKKPSKKITSYKKRENEHIENRILINFGIGVLAYILLRFLYVNKYMDDVWTFSFAGIFAICAVVFYVFSKRNEKLKNYAHMFSAFCAALIFTRICRIAYWIFGMSTYMKLYNIRFFNILFTTRYDVILISLLGAVYLAGMLIYNCILITKQSK